MRTTLPALLSLLALPAAAQCPFDAAITPSNVLLYCADEEVDLSTIFGDAYQWNRDGEPIAGANAQALTVSQMDVGAHFTVDVTIGGCTETSPEVLVDAWMGLLPFLQHGGDEPYDIGGNGESFYCGGDTMDLTLGGPYTANITWYKNGEPIPGETGTVLVVTTTGAYTATGTLPQCPDMVMGVGVDVGVIFTQPIQPEIVLVDGLICPDPSSPDVQWYLNGEPFSTEPCLEEATLEAGLYTVLAQYQAPCETISEPYLATGVGENNAPSFTVSPVPATEAVRINWPATATPQGGWQLLDMTGRTVRTGGFAGLQTVSIDVRSLAPGKYWFTAPGAQGWKPVAVAVVR